MPQRFQARPAASSTSLTTMRRKWQTRDVTAASRRASNQVSSNVESERLG